MKTYVIAAFAVTLSLVLAGCATQAQQQAKTIVMGVQGAVAQFKTCSDAVYATPAAAVIASKFARDPSAPTLEQLADQSYATSGEISAAYTVHDALQACRNVAVQQIAIVAPGLGNVYVEMFGKNDANVLLLVQKKTTWGEYNKASQQLAIEGKKVAQAEVARMQAALSQENAAEIAQRQQAAAILIQAWQNQQAINAMNRPITTTCNRIGTMATCTTN